MSFSEKIKEEILSSNNRKCCIIPLRFGELITESKDVLLCDIKNVVKKTCCKKAFLKGVFLGSGCVTDPNKDYHLELLVKSKNYMNFVEELMEEFGLHPKSTKRGNNFVIYIKESEQISVFLAIIEANKCVLEFENVRVNKSLKNDINRSVNFETANLNKTIEASYNQRIAIERLKSLNIFDKLSEKLKEAANLRLKYPEHSLDDLVKLASFKTSKSGLYHRLEKLVKLSEEK